MSFCRGNQQEMLGVLIYVRVFPTVPVFGSFQVNCVDSFRGICSGSQIVQFTQLTCFNKAHSIEVDRILELKKVPT